MHVIGTAGHVDHGKSTLVEALTGIDPDRFAEEKRRGLTIDLGFAWLGLPSGREVGLIDVPGHERFIKNMLAGAGGISVCLFVVAANEGWKPQSAEHLAILDVLGVSHGVVAVTKSDSVDPDTAELAVAEIEERIAGTSLEGAAVVACSAVSGAGLDELVAALDQALDAAGESADVGRPRLWVDRVFTIAGAGTVVTGTLIGGALQVGDAIAISPEERRARVRSIQSHKKEVERVGPGNRVALNLAGLDRQGAERGNAIVRPDRWRPTRLVDVTIRVLPAQLIGVEHELTDKGAHLMYVGSAETPVRLRLLGTKRLGADESGFAQLVLRDALPLARGDRFVLRDAGRVLTFGGGEILDPLAEPARRDDAERVALLGRLAGSDPTESLRSLVEAAGQMSAAEAALRSGGDLETAVGSVGDSGSSGVVRLADLVVSPTRLDALKALVVEAARNHHETHPLEPGMPLESARAATGLEAEAFHELVATTGELARQGAVIKAADFGVQLDPEQVAARARLVEAIGAGGFSPPMRKELDADESLLRALSDTGELVRVGDFYLTSDTAAAARKQVRAAIESTGPLTVAQIRDLLGTSRKYAVPLCEWLDQTGATVRRGDERVLGPNP